MSLDFLTPVNDAVLGIAALLPKQVIGKLLQVHTEKNGFPELENTHIAFFGVSESRNSYYRDLRQGALLGQIKLTLIEAGGFASYFAENEKVGGQNKVQHLANNRELADKLLKYVKKG